MASQDVPGVFATLFTAPCKAMVAAAAEQRQVWIDWLRDVERLSKGADDAAKRRIFERHLDLAPVWKLDAQVSIAIQMRVASINRTEGGFSLGLGVSVLQAAGTFGFMSESSSESVLSARAQYAYSNGSQVSLRDYLDTLGVSLDKPDALDSAIKRLGDASVPNPSKPS